MPQYTLTYTHGSWKARCTGCETASPPLPGAEQAGRWADKHECPRTQP